MSKQAKLAFISVFVVLAGFLLFVRPKPVLRVANWIDYIDPALVAQFEKEEKCKVQLDTFDSNEQMYARLKLGSVPYDLVVPSSYMARILADQGVLKNLDHSLVPNLTHVDSNYLKNALDREMKYSVPYMLSNTGIGYLKSPPAGDFQSEAAGSGTPSAGFFLEAPPGSYSWSVFDEKALAGRMTMLNDMRETMGAALKYLGYSLNTRNEKELHEARDVVLRWKKNLAGFANHEYVNGLEAQTLAIAQGYSGDILRAGSVNPRVGFAAPKEGIPMSCDDFVIPKNAGNPELAHKFINFLHNPKAAAQNITYLSYLCPNKDAYALLGAEVRNNPAIFLPPEVLAKSEVIQDLGPDNAKYIKMWQQIRAADGS